MKKVLAALLVMMMVLSLTACGKKEVIKKDFSNAQKKQQVQEKDEIPEESYVTPSEETKAPEETPEVPEEPEAPKAQTGSIEDYLNMPEVKSQMDALIDSMSGMGMTIEVTGEGNKLIYSYYFDTQLGDVETIRAGLEEGIKAQEATFKTIAKSLKEEINVENPVVVIKYFNADGSELYTVEFTAD